MTTQTHTPASETQTPDRCPVAYAAYQVLRLAADFPGMNGRLRAARIVGGFPVPHRDENEASKTLGYSVSADESWPLREYVGLIDTMLDGGLLAQTVGPRPVLVVTRAGHHALTALESDQRASSAA